VPSPRIFPRRKKNKKKKFLRFPIWQQPLRPSLGKKQQSKNFNWPWFGCRKGKNRKRRGKKKQNIRLSGAAPRSEDQIFLISCGRWASVPSSGFALGEGKVSEKGKVGMGEAGLLSMEHIRGGFTIHGPNDRLIKVKILRPRVPDTIQCFFFFGSTRRRRRRLQFQDLCAKLRARKNPDSPGGRHSPDGSSQQFFGTIIALGTGRRGWRRVSEGVSG